MGAWARNAPNFHGDSAIAIQRLDGPQHLTVNTKSLQHLPQEGPWHIIISPLQVQETYVQRLLLQVSMIYHML